MNMTLLYSLARCSPSSVDTSLCEQTHVPLVAQIGLVANQRNNHLVATLGTHILDPFGGGLERVAVWVSFATYS